MLRSISIVAAVAALFAVGALSAAAGNSHGKAVSHLATSTTLRAEAKGDAISTLARAIGEAAPSGATGNTARAKANVAAATAQAQADTDTDATETTDDATDSNEAADTNDANDQNHGATVSAIAHKDKGEADQGD
jgi:hypothetical protein